MAASVLRPSRVRLVGRLGGQLWAQWDELRHAAAVIGTVMEACVHPACWGRLGRKAFARQVLTIGVEPLGFVGAVAAFVGLSVVVQLTFWAGEAGQSQLLGPLLVTVVARELGPLLINLIVIVRNGSAMTAELGVRRGTRSDEHSETRDQPVGCERPGDGVGSETAKPNLKDKTMLISLSTHKAASETTAPRHAAVQAAHSGVMQVHHLKEARMKRGVAFARKYLLLRQLDWHSLRKPAIAVAGGSVVLLGIALLVLPGPAFLVIPLGLAILATEFLWARRWLKRARALLPNGNQQSPPPVPRTESSGKATDQHCHL
jgi:hypothetical protein